MKKKHILLKINAKFWCQIHRLNSTIYIYIYTISTSVVLSPKPVWSIYGRLSISPCESWCRSALPRPRSRQPCAYHGKAISTGMLGKHLKLNWLRILSAPRHARQCIRHRNLSSLLRVFQRKVVTKRVPKSCQIVVLQLDLDFISLSFWLMFPFRIVFCWFILLILSCRLCVECSFMTELYI